VALPRAFRRAESSGGGDRQHRALRLLPRGGRSLREARRRNRRPRHTNSERQGELPEAEEKKLLESCRERIAKESGRAPRGWLSPWISESAVTPDLLAETGYRYTLNWCHDDQPTLLRTRSGKPLWSIPYPQELNDVPMIVARQMDGRDFADLIVDNFDEMLRQCESQPLVMGIALHPYLVGQPYRLRHLRRALEHVASRPERVWWTTPGAILDAAEAAPRARRRESFTRGHLGGAAQGRRCT